MSFAHLFNAYPLEDYRAHRAEIDAAVQRTLDGGHYILGGEVDSFEREFAGFIGVKHAIGVANGTDSIELLLRALGIGAGSVVAAPSQTAVASISAIARTGATPVFVDVDPQTCTLSPTSLEQLARSLHGKNLKAVLAVHLYGHPADLAAIATVCEKYNLVLLEDCAQCHGAKHQGIAAGAIGRGSSFSFYPTKNLGAIGDGGGVCTNDDELADKVRSLRQYGWKERYISAWEGVNSRLDELQAAILRVKLKSLARSNARRRHLASLYAQGLAGLPVDLPVERSGCEHVYHLYVIRTRAQHRDALMSHLRAQGIPAALHYPAAVHQQPAYDHITRSSPPLPNTDALVPEILSLPLHPYLSDEAVQVTCGSIRAYFQSVSHG